MGKYTELVEASLGNKSVGITFHKGDKSSYVDLLHRHPKETFPEKLIKDFLKSYSGSDVAYDFVMATYNKGHIVSCSQSKQPVLNGDAFYVVDVNKKTFEKE